MKTSKRSWDFIIKKYMIYFKGNLKSYLASGPAGAMQVPLECGPPKIVGSEQKEKRHPKNFIKEEQEIVNEVMDYLLGITVG